MITNCALSPDGRSLVITESATGSILISRGSSAMSEHVNICEVGPRDGLQIAKTRMTTDAKVRLDRRHGRGRRAGDRGRQLRPRRASFRSWRIREDVVRRSVADPRADGDRAGAEPARCAERVQRGRAQDQHAGLGQRGPQPRQPQSHTGGKHRRDGAADGVGEGPAAADGSDCRRIDRVRLLDRRRGDDGEGGAR